MDSITLRVHFPVDNQGLISEHQELFNALTLMSDANRSKYKTDLEFGVNSVEQIIEHFTLKPVHLIAKELNYFATESTSHFVKGRVKLPSNHYDIGYFLNLEQYYVDFSFSLPKFIYGQSVTQLLHNPHMSARHFKGYHSSFLDNAYCWHDIFHRSVRLFFKNIFLDCPINYKLVELVRIDFCFNQYFESKDECFMMLPQMANKANTGLRGKSGKNGQYRVDEVNTNSFIIAGRNAYYKIYHKGTEFESANGDKRTLIKINNKQQKIYSEWKKMNLNIQQPPKILHHVEALQAEADKILRHEIRFFSKNMSYYFKKYVFRKNNTVWQNNMALVNRITTSMSEVEKSVKIPRQEKILFKLTKKQLEQRHRFFLDADEATKRNAIDGVEHYTNQFLSKTLFDFLIEKFYKTVEGSQLSELPEWDKLKLAAISWNKKKLQDHKFTKRVRIQNIPAMSSVNAWQMNEPVEAAREIKPDQIGLTTLKKLHEQIKQFGSLDAMRDINIISSRSYYRWRKFFKEINLQSSFISRPVKIDITFRTYFHQIHGLSSAIPIGSNMYDVYFSAMSSKNKDYF